MKAMIFDMDGVLVDSEPMHIEMDLQMVRDYGIEVTQGVLDKFVGVSNEQMWRELKETYKLPYTLDSLISRAEATKLEGFSTLPIELIEGIKPLMSILRNQGVKMAVASSSDLTTIEVMLTRLGIYDEFDVIVSGQEVEKK